jgi:16S rRNA processing protein RimM
MDEALPEASKDSDADFVRIGYTTKAHGIRGELSFVLTAESVDLVSGTLFLRPRHGGAARPYAVAGVRSHHGNLLLSLRGVTDRNAAERLRSHTALVPRDALPPLAEDEIYLRDLIGLEVYVAAGKTPLGVIRSAEAPAGQPLWTILAPDGREILFPAVEEFVLSIDMTRGEARIAPPPGLLDLYLGG